MYSCEKHFFGLVEYWKDKLTVEGGKKLLMIQHVKIEDLLESSPRTRCHSPRCRQDAVFNLTWDEEIMRSRLKIKHE